MTFYFVLLGREKVSLSRNDSSVQYTGVSVHGLATIDSKPVSDVEALELLTGAQSRQQTDIRC